MYDLGGMLSWDWDGDRYTARDDQWEWSVVRVRGGWEVFCNDDSVHFCASAREGRDYCEKHSSWRD